MATYEQQVLALRKKLDECKCHNMSCLWCKWRNNRLAFLEGLIRRQEKRSV